MVELPYAMFDAQDKLMKEIIAKGCGKVAGDGKIYCASENGVVYVLRAGPGFEILARNQLGEPCFATPAIAEGALYFRTTSSLIAVTS